MTAPPGELPAAVRAALASSFGAGPEAVRCLAPARLARMSGAARIAVRDATGATRTVFAKWSSPRPGVRRLARRTGAYLREVRFYQELAPDCGVRTPRVHFADLTPAGDCVLLLEDFPGARVGDCLHSSVADVRHLLRMLAALHARWWGAARLAELPWLPAFGDPRVDRYARVELDRVVRAVARHRPGEHLAAAVIPLLASLRDRMDDFLRWAASEQTLIHGDLHADQVLFPAGGGSVLVDWQLVGRGHPGLDVARLITLSLPTGERRRHEHALLDDYGRALAAAGAPAGRAAARLAAYRWGIAWTALVNASFARVGDSGRPSAGLDRYQVMFCRIAAAAADHGLPARA